MATEDYRKEETLTGDDKIIAEAKRRFKHCENWESETRKRFIEDIKFANGDPDNRWQWPNDIYNDRNTNNRPCLTINKVRVHNLQIKNDQKQNKPSVTIRPTGDGATFRSAEIFEGVVRHIEYISNAQVAYDTASDFQVDGGVGYWRVVTDYRGDDSFDQEIYIRRIKNPLTVYLDPDINELDGSDAKFAFVFDDLPREEFDRVYPEYKNRASLQTLNNSIDDGWIEQDKVRVAEYYRRVPKEDELIAYTDPNTGEQRTLLSSDLPPEIAEIIMADKDTRIRQVTGWTVEWYLICGDQIIDRTIWPGIYIPVVRIVGEEMVVEGRLDRKGHTRCLKDAQRMYNYQSSAEVEYGALQSKSPWVGPAAAIEGYETYWGTANTQNHSILPYNHKDDQGGELPPPTRQNPPTGSGAFIEGMKIAREELMMASGQYDENMGNQTNAISGTAISQRQRKGDNATYHFVNNLAVGIRYTGKILLDLIPKVYDVERTIRILAENGDEEYVKLDPKLKQAYFEQRRLQGDQIDAIFNPNVGTYEVQADVGPNYATRRQEAFNAISQILMQNESLTTLIGDLLFRSADFPDADEIAERLKNMVPPQALGQKGPTPAEQQMNQVISSQQSLIATMTEELGVQRLKLEDKSSQKLIDVFKAETDRLKALLDKAVVTPKDSAQMLHELMREEHKTVLNPVVEQNKQELKE